MTWRPVSPDGSRVVFFDGQYLLYAVDEGQPQPIPGLQRGEIVIGWTPDGRALYVRSTRQTPVKIFRLDVSTGHRQLWKGTGATEGWAQLAMTPDGGAYAYGHPTSTSDLYLVEGLK